MSTAATEEALFGLALWLVEARGPGYSLEAALADAKVLVRINLWEAK